MSNDHLPDLRADVVLHRLAGAPFQAIATLNDITIAKARYYCRRAVKSGLATNEQLRLKPSPKPLRIPPEQYDAHWLRRVRARLVPNEGGCHIWQGSKNGKGYGLTYYRKASTRVHRTLFELVKGVDLRPTDFVCHRCDQPDCANIDHLFLGDNEINTADRTAKSRHHELRVTHCPQGHEYTAENTYRPPCKPTARRCRACSRSRGKRKSA